MIILQKINMLKKIASIFSFKKRIQKKSSKISNKKISNTRNKEKFLVKEFMTSNVFTLNTNQTLYDAYKLFSEKNISGAPVLEKKNLVGVVSKTDILKLINKRDLIEINEKDFEILKKHKVCEVMKKPICINENATIEAARRKMEKKKIKRLLVINKKGKLVGIITLTDLIRGVSKEEIKEKIYTKIDDMLKLLEKKEMSIKDLANKLSISENMVEEWAKILEEKGLIEINYKPFSSPIVKIKSKIE